MANLAVVREGSTNGVQLSAGFSPQPFSDLFARKPYYRLKNKFFSCSKNFGCAVQFFIIIIFLAVFYDFLCDIITLKRFFRLVYIKTLNYKQLYVM